MDVVCDASNLDRRRIAAFECACEIRVRTVAELFVREKRAAILRREHDVQVDLREGLGQGALSPAGLNRLRRATIVSRMPAHGPYFFRNAPQTPLCTTASR